MTYKDDDEEVRSGYAAREQERQWLAGPAPKAEWIEERGELELEPEPELEPDETASRERMKRRIEDEYNRNRFGIEDDDRIGRVWGGDDDMENEPTGVIRTAGLHPPEQAELRYVPGRARMGRDGDDGPAI